MNKSNNCSTPIILLEYEDDGIAIVKMSDPENKNALTGRFVNELSHTVAALTKNEKIKVVILQGLDDVFCSGADLETLTELGTGRIKPTDILLPREILRIPVPVIAAMSGHAVGGGFALGLCADIILIAKQSRYGCSFMNMGFTPGMGITKLLENVLSPVIAHELQYTGEFKLGSDFIGKHGFNEILSKEQVVPKAIEIARRIAEKPRPVLETLKRYLSMSKRTCFEETITVETMMHEISFSQMNIEGLIYDNFVE